MLGIIKLNSILHIISISRKVVILTFDMKHELNINILFILHIDLSSQKKYNFCSLYNI